MYTEETRQAETPQFESVDRNGAALDIDVKIFLPLGEAMGEDSVRRRVLNVLRRDGHIVESADYIKIFFQVDGIAYAASTTAVADDGMIVGTLVVRGRITFSA